VPAAAGPRVDATSVTFRVADADRHYSQVHLRPELPLPADRLAFTQSDAEWVLRLDRPPVQRMEYLLDVRHVDGLSLSMVDPANSCTAPGAFGERSVVEFPGYRPPPWLDAAAVEGRWVDLSVPSRSLGKPVDVRIWAPANARPRAALPLLIAHDGPEYDTLSRLSQYCSAAIAAGTLPPHRLALLAPGDRDEWYSCSSQYASALIRAVLPALMRTTTVAGAPVGMGASLGALAMLHAQRRFPASFAALFLQSGSFFRPRFDAHESRFGRYQRIVRCVDEMVRVTRAADPVPVAMTCGTVEENMANNQLMARALAAQGHEVALHPVADAHNYTAWRDAFHPYLTQLLRRVWTMP
jgi:enterochelin esterase family protein